MSSIEYHLEELKISLDERNENRILPDIRDADKTILDIGCGIGQSFIALNYPGATRVGLDNDEEALHYGIEHYGDKIQFIFANAARIPMPSAMFDFVFSRVALPYTNIPKVVKEIRRVLRPGGRVWMTVLGKDTADEYVLEARRGGNIKRLLYFYYILANGYLFKYFRIVLPFLNGRFESWQDTAAMERLLRRHGFMTNTSQVGKHTVIEGELA